jgi:hypothetical protein
MQQPLASPDANNPHPLKIVAIHDEKWRMGEFTQDGSISGVH